jgi:hypothetical protein
MVVLGNEQAVLPDVGSAEPVTAANEPDGSDLDLATLGADFSESQELDLKAISKRAAQIAEKKGDRTGPRADPMESQGGGGATADQLQGAALQDEGKRTQ